MLLIEKWNEPAILSLVILRWVLPAEWSLPVLRESPNLARRVYPVCCGCATGVVIFALVLLLLFVPDVVILDVLIVTMWPPGGDTVVWLVDDLCPVAFIISLETKLVDTIGDVDIWAFRGPADIGGVAVAVDFTTELAADEFNLTIVTPVGVCFTSFGDCDDVVFEAWLYFNERTTI